jgi:hypothetical protein
VSGPGWTWDSGRRLFLRDDEDNIKMDKIIIDLACGYVNSVKLAPG